MSSSKLMISSLVLSSRFPVGSSASARAALLRRSLGDGAPLQWDAWAFWLPKAKSLLDFGGLDTAVGGFTSFANPGYPPLVPALEAEPG